MKLYQFQVSLIFHRRWYMLFIMSCESDKIWSRFTRESQIRYDLNIFLQLLPFGIFFSTYIRSLTILDPIGKSRDFKFSKTIFLFIRIIRIVMFFNTSSSEIH